jgi:adsorption protein B
MLTLNGGLLCWRLVARVMHTSAEHGWGEGLRAVPRAMVSNYVAMLAARRALTRYLASFFGLTPRWEKTVHRFPDELPVSP